MTPRASLFALLCFATGCGGIPGNQGPTPTQSATDEPAPQGTLPGTVSGTTATPDANSTPTPPAPVRSPVLGRDDGSYRLQSFVGMMLDLAGSNPNDDAQLVQWMSDDGDNQRWYLKQGNSAAHAYQIHSWSSHKCLTLTTAVPGSPVAQSTCSGALEQEWLFMADANGKLSVQHASTKLCLAIGAASTNQGARVVLDQCTNSPATTWTFSDRTQDYAAFAGVRFLEFGASPLNKIVSMNAEVVVPNLLPAKKGFIYTIAGIVGTPGTPNYLPLAFDTLVGSAVWDTPYSSWSNLTYHVDTNNQKTNPSNSDTPAINDVLTTSLVLKGTSWHVMQTNKRTNKQVAIDFDAKGHEYPAAFLQTNFTDDATVIPVMEFRNFTITVEKPSPTLCVPYRRSPGTTFAVPTLSADMRTCFVPSVTLTR